MRQNSMYSVRVTEAFWARVAPPNERGCRLWTGNKFDNGYGQFHETGTGRRRRAHRVAYELRHGPIPEGLVVRHSCDVKLCMEHLLLGTHADNERDAMERNRKPRGERVGGAKLTADIVKAIREESGTQQKIAAKYGITQANVSLILMRRTWAHV